ATDVEGLAAAAGGQDPVALLHQHLGQEVARHRIVVGNQDRGDRRHAVAPVPGNARWNVVPVPVPVSTSMSPPWSRTTCWVMDRPNPAPSPSSLVVKNGS